MQYEDDDENKTERQKQLEQELSEAEVSADNLVAVKADADLLNACKTMNQQEARYLVDSYYQTQLDRIGFAHKIRSMKGEPHAALEWWLKSAERTEKAIAKGLLWYANEHHMGRWAMSVTGIGPIIAAGLLAYIDITKAPTVGHIWSFAGLNPDMKWLGREGAKRLVSEVLPPKGKITEEHLRELARLSCRNPETVLRACAGLKRDAIASWLAKRPWNARLKVIAYKIGESFIKVSNNPKSLYGQMFKERKAYENENNNLGKYADQAEVKAMQVGKSTKAYTFYSKGQLPPGHINARARHYVAKQFLADWHAEAYRDHYKTEPPLPYPIAILGHAHLRAPEVK